MLTYPLESLNCTKRRVFTVNPMISTVNLSMILIVEVGGLSSNQQKKHTDFTRKIYLLYSGSHVKSVIHLNLWHPINNYIIL